MRSCEEFEYLINLYLDDMLPSEDRQALMEHLESCPACRACYEELRAMKTALGQMEAPVPSDLHHRILTYVEQNSGAKEKQSRVLPFRARRWVRGLTGVAACAVLAVVAARFVPQLDFAVSEDSAEKLVMDTASPSVGLPESNVAPAEDQNMPDNAVVIAPTLSDSFKEYHQAESSVQDTSMAPAPAPEETENGQMAEDLPPLRAENVDARNEYQVTTVCKWLKVTGKREALPDWVDRHFVYEAELDGTSREYVEIAAWAEEYWTDQLTACGFAVEELTDQDVVEEGEHILLIFFWE